MRGQDMLILLICIIVPAVLCSSVVIYAGDTFYADVGKGCGVHWLMYSAGRGINNFI